MIFTDTRFRVWRAFFDSFGAPVIFRAVRKSGLHGTLYGYLLLGNEPTRTFYSEIVSLVSRRDRNKRTGAVRNTG